ncbi:hypothetical protein D5018_15325 [Parashewanella curva]|uniref:Uncharacterized protein n=1 Tax=Parashewanella curva TaxID=2338552 RepID=A0A3L8PXM1_9GAMM|nr:hypothetical protein [Parashewanella curva]RLV58822.1 hypothetical protein D5018_15325 [Parashewanella curva]
MATEIHSLSLISQLLVKQSDESQFLDAIKNSHTFKVLMSPSEQTDCESVLDALNKSGVACLTTTDNDLSLKLCLNMVRCVEEHLIWELNQNNLKTMCISHTEYPCLEFCFEQDKSTSPKDITAIHNDSADQDKLRVFSEIIAAKKNNLFLLANRQTSTMPFWEVYKSKYNEESSENACIRQEKARELDHCFIENMEKNELHICGEQNQNFDISQIGVTYFFRLNGSKEWHVFSIKPADHTTNSMIWCCKVSDACWQERWQDIKPIMPSQVKAELRTS